MALDRRQPLLLLRQEAERLRRQRSPRKSLAGLFRAAVVPALHGYFFLVALSQLRQLRRDVLCPQSAAAKYSCLSSDLFIASFPLAAALGCVLKLFPATLSAALQLYAALAAAQTPWTARICAGLAAGLYSPGARGGSASAAGALLALAALWLVGDAFAAMFYLAAAPVALAALLAALAFGAGDLTRRRVPKPGSCGSSSCGSLCSSFCSSLFSSLLSPYIWLILSVDLSRAAGACHAYTYSFVIALAALFGTRLVRWRRSTALLALLGATAVTVALRKCSESWDLRCLWCESAAAVDLQRPWLRDRWSGVAVSGMVLAAVGAAAQRPSLENNLGFSAGLALGVLTLRPIGQLLGVYYFTGGLAVLLAAKVAAREIFGRVLADETDEDDESSSTGWTEC